MPTFTQTFLPRAFGPTGKILGVDIIWSAMTSLTNKFVSTTTNDYYMQGYNMYWVRSSSQASDITLTTNTIQVGTPADFNGAMNFYWDTYKNGIFSDTKVESGTARIDFSVKEYKYDINITQTSGKYVATLKNFNCTFVIDKLPVLDGTPTDRSKNLSESLKQPIQDTLNKYYCPKVSAALQTALTSFLTIAQTSQKLTWSYDKYSMTKTMPLSPNDVQPFDSQRFVIIGNATLQLSEHEQAEKSQQVAMRELKDEVRLESDGNLREQVDDLCIILNQDMITNMLTTNVNFYKQYKIVVNGASGGQKYYPFNLWQFWEVTLYDLDLYAKIGNEKGKYKQVDPITLRCEYSGSAAAKITNEGTLDITGTFSCTTDLVDSNDGSNVVNLYTFTFDTTSSASFYITGKYLNIKIDRSDVTNVNGVKLNSVDILEDITDRFQIPFINQLTANVKLFGTSGIKLDYIENKKISSSILGEDVQVCFK